MRRRLGFALASFLVGLILGEGVLRAIGIHPRPRRGPTPRWVIDPQGSFFRYSEPRGYAYGPGDFTVTLRSGFEFEVSHDVDGYRRTAPRPRDGRDAPRPEVWILGGSFAYGWAVEDFQTTPWLLQERLPEVRVRNLGICGYGTLLSWLQFEEALAAGERPRAVVLAYGSFHDERNTWTRTWRRGMGTAHPLPRARIRNGALSVEQEVPRYRAFPLVHHLALMELLEGVYGRLENRLVLRSRQVAEQLLLAFQARCQEEQIQFLVAGIMRNRATRERLAFCRESGIDAVDISVDLEAPGLRNLPHDPHPSPAAHLAYAERLVEGLRNRLDVGGAR